MGVRIDELPDVSALDGAEVAPMVQGGQAKKGSLAAIRLWLLNNSSLSGVPTAPGIAADTNNAQVANTAFVLGQASSVNPNMDGVAAIGGSLRYARADHVHPSDTSRAPLNSPVLTGSPTTPTPAGGANALEIANASWVLARIAALVASSPATLDTLNELAAALANDPNFATTMTNALALKAPLNSPGLTGTPTAPTAAADTNTTQLATMAAIMAQAGAALPLAPGTAAAGSSLRFSRQDHVHPTDTTRAPATHVGKFRAHRNAVNQTGMTASAFNKVNLTTEDLDSSNWFDSATNFRFTPQEAGTYLIMGSVAASAGTGAGDTPIAAIYKNGSLHREGAFIANVAATALVVVPVQALVVFNGTTDYVELWVALPVGSTTVFGTTTRTFLEGIKISA